MGPGLRRTLNFINNRRWFDNEQDRSPAAEEMYVAELREFRDYVHEHTNVKELKEVNIRGVQFALREALKYFFYFRYESGPLYRPASRDFQFVFQDVSAAEAKRLRAIWAYWEQSPEESGEIIDEQLHPDHLIPH